MRLPKAKGLFITGTDTGVGKTFVTQLLIQAFHREGYQTIGCKPISCGQDGDEVIYQKINSLQLPRGLINPFHFSLPVSPNIAAEDEEKSLSAKEISAKASKLLDFPINYVLFEGIGGVKVPINQRETTIDIVKNLKTPLVIVVGIRVGCLNHALLTIDTILNEKLPIAGWIANVIVEDTPKIDAHIETLQNWLTVPYLGKVDFCKTGEVQTTFDVQKLIVPQNCYSREG